MILDWFNPKSWTVIYLYSLGRADERKTGTHFFSSRSNGLRAKRRMKNPGRLGGLDTGE